MAVKAKASITISRIIDILSVTRYYLLQSSTSAAPAKPTTNPPSSSWAKTEPSYTSGSTKTLYFVDCTEFTNGTFKYSEVSKSSSYEAAKEAYNKAQNAQNTANSAKDYTDKMKNQHGYQYKYDITINGDAGTYYPVVLRGGEQNVMREILVARGHSEQAPEEWNGHPTVHGISLLLKMKCNFGGWGGANYSWWIHDFEEMYGHVFASAGWCMSYMGFYIFLRGGGETGALYHIYSDQPLNVTYMNGTSPTVYYNSDRIGWTGGTSDNPTYSWNAPAPRTYTDAIKNEIDNKRYINLASDAHSRVISAETKIEQNKNAIALRATKTEVETTVNNIKVGGRNILLNSSFKKSTDEWYVATPAISGEGYLYADDVSPVEHNISCAVSSKNLIPYPYYNFSLEQNGVTATLGNDGSITLNGTALENVAFRIYDNTKGTKKDFIVKPEIKYTASGIPNGASTTTYRLRITTMNDRAHDFVDNSYTQQFNITEDTAVKWVFVTVNKGVTVNNLVFKPQLELGTIATAYTPYVPDLTAVKVTRCGKNLLPYPYSDSSKSSVGATITVNEDRSISFSGTPTSYIGFVLYRGNALVKSGIFTLSVGNLTNVSANLFIYDSGGATLKTYSFTKSVTVNADDYPMAATWNITMARAANNQQINGTAYPQLELGSTATDYEPYITPVEYTPSSNGTVSGIKSISPNMTLISDTDGVILRVNYISGAFVEKYGKQCVKFSNKYLNYNKYCMQQLLGKIEPNTQYTLSGWILSEHVTKGTTNPLLSLYIELTYDNNGTTGSKAFTNIPFDVNTGTGSWKYVSTTFTSSDKASLSNTLNLYFAVFMRDVIGEFYFYNLKLEKGNKATDWEPAYEDTKTDIEKVAAIASSNKESISSLLVNTDSISASVSKLQTDTAESIDGIKEDISTLKQAVDVAITSEDVQIQIQNEMAKGSTKVVTNTGFTFDENGLNISKSNSPTNTQITENGMTVNNTESGEAVLTANKEGVDAANLKATTYLIIGGRSRFENYGTNRTGCFWIGE